MMLNIFFLIFLQFFHCFVIEILEFGADSFSPFEQCFSGNHRRDARATVAKRANFALAAPTIVALVVSSIVFRDDQFLHIRSLSYHSL